MDVRATSYYRATAVHNDRDMNEILRIGKDEIDYLEGKKLSFLADIWQRFADTWQSVSRLARTVNSDFRRRPGVEVVRISIDIGRGDGSGVLSMSWFAGGGMVDREQYHI